MADRTPTIEDYATIEAYVGPDETPVYAFGSTYVYGVSPDVLPGVVMQEGNPNPATKFTPKKSWEITSNLCGLTPTREPKTRWNDDQPLRSIHLIDGDPETAWCSHGETAAWIRVDLAQVSTVTSIVLVCSEIGPSGGRRHERAGKVLPKHVTVRLSTNATDWETVYENAEFSGDDFGPNVIKIEPRAAKQVWILGADLGEVFWYSPAFSIGQVEVRDADGVNVAHIARGAGVQVSSTDHGITGTREAQEILWPLHYDLGFKWTRVGYDLGVFLWKSVEREKGRLEIDAAADAAVTEAYESGLQVILCLDKGNWLYADPPRKTDWKKARTRELMETYFDPPPWPQVSDEMLEGYLRYVRYMVKHFAGRVAYFEITNEWRNGISISDYMKIVRATIPAIREADPTVRIMLGSPSGFDTDGILACLGRESVRPTLAIKDGKFRLPGHEPKPYCVIRPGVSTLLVDGVAEHDVRVTVAAQSTASAGITLRARDSANYLLAAYSSGSVYFQEVVDGAAGEKLSPASAPDLDGEIQLTAEIGGDDVVLTASDGTHSYTTHHTVERLTEAGTVGLYHDGGAPQAFANFVATALDGRALVSESFERPEASVPNGWSIDSENYPRYEVGVGAQVDAIGWHPYQDDPESPHYREYRERVEQFKKDCEALGFRGQYAVTEWSWYANWTEIGDAKYTTQYMVMNCGLGLISLFNEAVRMLRSGHPAVHQQQRIGPFKADPFTPMQPMPNYYAVRSLSTAFDGFRPASFSVEFDSDRELDCYTFDREDGARMIAAWIPGSTEQDAIVEARADVRLPRLNATHATVVDILNGTEQALVVRQDGDDTILPGMLIKDYPVMVRLEQ